MAAAAAGQVLRLVAKGLSKLVKKGMRKPGKPMRKPGKPMKKPGKPMKKPGKPMRKPGKPMVRPETKDLRRNDGGFASKKTRVF